MEYYPFFPTYDMEGNPIVVDERTGDDTGPFPSIKAAGDKAAEMNAPHRGFEGPQGPNVWIDPENIPF